MSPKTSLPISSRQETLETISRNQLALLFDPSIFELRSESQRDKGIDIIGEIKQNGLYTNFRFSIQVKSTETAKKQKDGSISYPIEISNLNYLLNFGLPGFYVLYDYPDNQFYIESVGEVYRSLMKKYHADALPKTFKVKFTRPLDQQKIDGIYKETFEAGTLLKKINIQMQGQANIDKQAKSFVIDQDQDVYNVQENIEFIEQAGYDLLNQHAHPFIIDIEQRSHPRSKTSAIFNMVCGIAYYHQSHLLKAVELLKLAHAEIENLHLEARNMLSYTLLNAKYLLGLITEQNFRKETEKIIADENSGAFLQLRNLHNQFLGNEKAHPKDRIKEYYRNVMQLVNKNPDCHDLRILVYAKILDVESTTLLHELAKNSIRTMGIRKDTFRDILIGDWIQFNSQFVFQLRELFDYAFEHKNFLALSNLMMQKAEWEFAKVYHFHTFRNWDRKKMTVNLTVETEDHNFLLGLLGDISQIEETYKRLQHRENQFNCLRLKYEILDFLGNKEQADACAKVMGELIVHYEMNALQSKFQQMLQGNMRHRRFISDLTQRKSTIDVLAKNSGIYEHLYDDVTTEMNEVLSRKPEWLMNELFHLTYPDETLSGQ